LKHEILSAGQPVLASPPEGLWSIACDWREGWPADWHHANPSEQISAGGWTILKDEVNACGGAWLIEDAYRSQGRALKGVRRFTWKGSRLAPKVTLSVRFQAVSDRANVLLPGIIYYGNPSGGKSGRVPVLPPTGSAASSRHCRRTSSPTTTPASMFPRAR